jgi:hypothetical protein
MRLRRSESLSFSLEQAQRFVKITAEALDGLPSFVTSRFTHTVSLQTSVSINTCFCIQLEWFVKVFESGAIAFTNILFNLCLTLFKVGQTPPMPILLQLK